MGCGESKHQVATENTITKIKSRKLSKPADGSLKTTKVAENIPQNDKISNTSLRQQQQQEESKNASLHGQQRQEGDQGKDGEQSKKPQEENSETQNVNENSANNREELYGNAKNVEAIISDGISGKTEYYSPRSYEVGSGKFGDQDGEESLIDQEETKVERETENGAGDPGKVKEAVTEALAPSTAQERTANDNKESAF